MIQTAAGVRPVSEVGEFALIEGIRKVIGGARVSLPQVTVGIGDDAAVWQPTAGRALAVSTDMLVEQVHFRRDWSEAAQIGHRALAVNLSDMAAMGALPRFAVVSLGLTGRETDRWVFDLYRGLAALGQRWRVQIIGGDIVTSPNQTTISVTAHGEVHPSRIMRRNTAEVGDVIGVTGPLGLAAGGLRLLTEGTLRRDGAPGMLAAHRTPQPRVMHGLLLSWAGVRCAMDLSDGLLGDLPRICTASDVVANLELSRMPVPQALRWNFADWQEMALRGGEDYELLFTAPPEVFSRVERIFKRFNLQPPTQIGEVVKPRKDKQVLMLRGYDLIRRPLHSGAFDHFAPPPLT